MGLTALLGGRTAGTPKDFTAVRFEYSKTCDSIHLPFVLLAVTAVRSQRRKSHNQDKAKNTLQIPGPPLNK